MHSSSRIQARDAVLVRTEGWIHLLGFFSLHVSCYKFSPHAGTVSRSSTILPPPPSVPPPSVQLDLEFAESLPGLTAEQRRQWQSRALAATFEALFRVLKTALLRTAAGGHGGGRRRR